MRGITIGFKGEMRLFLSWICDSGQGFFWGVMVGVGIDGVKEELRWCVCVVDTLYTLDMSIGLRIHVFFCY